MKLSKGLLLLHDCKSWKLSDANGALNDWEIKYYAFKNWEGLDGYMGMGACISHIGLTWY